MNPISKKSLSAVLALTLGTAGYAPCSFAKAPLDQFELESINQVYSETLKQSDVEFKNLLEIKNAKGERIFFESAPKDEPKLWATLDLTQDSVHGTSTEAAYQKFDLGKSKNEIIVAVIDSGVDIYHEDLQGKIWVNQAEKDGAPGVDDDGNGYVDDVYGWNFLGNKNGQNIDGQTLEVTRELVRLKKKLETSGLSTEEQVYFARVKKEYTEGAEKKQDLLERYLGFQSAFKLLKQNGLKEDSAEGLEAVTSTDPLVQRAKSIAAYLYSKGASSAYVDDAVKEIRVGVEFHYNQNFNSSDIVGDNPDVLDEKGYGNNDVIGPDASHGTHVSGIIAADRTNNLGIIGQATQVKIMVVRAVPNGDETDKDVANAIRYAVNNGAKIINMSFGKSFSPYKDYVDSAVEYAEEKGVLLVHAAGNSSKNTETFDNNFPNQKLAAQGPHANNWVEVGASGRNNSDGHLAADFTNYGKTSVDLFAPGVDIVSTIPGNEYASFQGTSMASPEVAGVAAILWSEYPDLTAKKIAGVLAATTVKKTGVRVKLPQDDDEAPNAEVLFTELSSSGGIVNTYRAMEFLKLTLPTPRQ